MDTDRLIFLGTGGDAVVVGKQALSSGGFVIQTEGMQFHIDPGPGALVNARRCGINPRENTAILVSHAHIGHCSDVNALISATTFAGLDPQSVLIAPKSLLSPEDNNVPYVPEFFRNAVERIIVVKPGNKIGIQRVEIHATKAVHPGEEHAVGFRFLCPKFTLAYTGDTQYFKDIEEEYKGMDILILNVQEPFGKKKAGHLSADDVITIISKIRPKLAVLTHFGSKLLQEDPINTGREISKLTNVQVLVAKDGSVINPVNSSSGQRQKTLNIYD